jgi:phosphomannomutase
LDRIRKAVRPLGALAGLTGAAALLNRSLRERGPLPVDHIGGTRRPWTWRTYDIFVTELGPAPSAPTGMPILLVHGIYAGASSYEFRKLAPLLAGSHRVVAMDFLGCGLSDMPDLTYTAELFVEQIVDALGEFFEGPMLLVGSSLGAAFAIRASVRAPDRVRALAVIAPTGLGGVLDKEPTPAQRAVAALIRSPLAGETAWNALASRKSLRFFLRFQSYADPASITPEIIDNYYAQTHQPGARIVPSYFIGGALNTDVARDLPFVEAPLLVLWGDAASQTNPVRNAQEYARLAPSADVATFPNAGLIPHEEVPEATARAIEGFLAEETPLEDRNARDMPSRSVPDIFKSYDIRGLYPTELSDELAYDLGRAFVAELGVGSIVAGRDMRPSGEALFAAFARGANESGADVTDVGLVSTDALYFAVGKYGFEGGVMITASHNPAQYNGLKMTRDRAQAISLETGLSAMRERIASGTFPPPAAKAGRISHRDVLEDFAQHCLSFVDPAKIKPFKIAIDAGNGMGGLTVPYVFKHLPCEVTPLYFELDGTFPNHPASPIEPENMVDLQKAVLEHGCDLGVAFDGDADRMFIVDEKGRLVGGDIVTALVAINTLKRYPGAKILYNLICSRSVPEAILRSGGVPVRSQVGHSLIKKTMREEDVVFGGEHSGHFYFRDNWFADSGMIALMQCLEVFSDAGRPVSEVIAPIDARFRSGEINSRVLDIPAKLAALEEHFGTAEIDHLDGLTVQYPNWWMNVRPSNTEPLLRLNVEGDTLEAMERHRDEALNLIRA